ncbi:MAG: hypothetical protein ABI846_06945 [Rudaea sp.]
MMTRLGACSAFVAAAAWAVCFLTPSASAQALQADVSVDASALQRAHEKFTHALAIAARFAPRSADGFADRNWAHAFVARVMAGDETRFADLENAEDAADAMRRAYAIRSVPVDTATGAKSLGAVTTDLVYVPFASPCRIVDTRVSGGPIAAGATRTFNYGNANASGATCNASVLGAPPAAEAVNVTMDETGISGFPAGAYIAIYPQAGSAGTSFLNFGPNQIIANAGVIPLNENNGQFTVLASARANLIVDAFGVFAGPLPTALECTTVAGTNSFLGSVSASCGSGFTLTGGGCKSSSIYDHAYQAYPSDATSFSCGFLAETGQTLGSVSAYARCCRVPGKPTIEQ